MYGTYRSGTRDAHSGLACSGCVSAPEREYSCHAGLPELVLWVSCGQPPWEVELDLKYRADVVPCHCFLEGERKGWEFLKL